MNELIRDNIDWAALPPEGDMAYRCEVEDAYIGKKTGLLTVALGLNFVVPYQDDRKIKQAIAKSLPGIPGVQLEYRYDREHMAVPKESILKNYAARMVHERGGLFGRAVDPASAEAVGDQVVFTSFGKLATKKLNEEEAGQISASLEEAFGLDCQVRFEYDEESYSAAERKLMAAEAAVPVYEDCGFEEMPSGDDFEEALAAMGAVETGLAGERGLAGASEAASAAADSGPAAVNSGTAAAGFSPAAAPAGSGPAGRRTPARKPAARRRAAAASLEPRGKRILGKAITEAPIPMTQVSQDSGTVVVAGVLFHKESRALRRKKVMITYLLTDKKSTVCLKAFLKEEKFAHLDQAVQEGDYLICRGDAEWDRFDNETNVMVKDISLGTAPVREDTWPDGKRVELHCHTKMSAMDGLNDPKRIVDLAAGWGQPAVAITDHGVVQAFPDAAEAAEKQAKKGRPIKVLYGMEGYLYDDAGCIDEKGNIDYKKKNTNHIILLCRTQAGLQNLYKLVSISHLHYFYKKPRLPRSILDQYREGLIVGSACEAGELYRAIEEDRPEEELERIASYYDYLEIQPLVNNKFLLEKGFYDDPERLRENNRRVTELGRRLGKPVCATTDAHYDEPESAIYRNIVLKSMGFKDAENGRGLYLRTTDEMMEEFSYLGPEDARRVVIEGPNQVAGWVEDGILPVPKEKFPPKIEGAEETLRTTCYQRAHEIYGDPLPQPIQERLDTELNAIISNGYAVMYVSAQLLVKKSLEDGYLVGSRGSVGSSFAATMAGITEVNPLEPHYICPKCKKLIWGDKKEYDNGLDMPPMDCPDCGTPMKRDGFTIPFATFLGFKGNKEPDIDLNFATDYQSRAQKYVGVIFGEENVYKAGTVGTLQGNTAFGYVHHFFEETGRPVNKYEVSRLVDGLLGVKRTTGQHPGGMVVVPRDHDITEFCPVQHPADANDAEFITTHFDYHKIDQNLLKLDILGHNVPSMIRQLQDMTGVDPLKVDLTDQKVLSIFNGTEALDIQDPDYRFTHGSYAIPEFGTSFVRKMLDDVKPQRFEDLVRMSGFSHGTDVWLNNAQEYIRDGVATMREVISTRDDIMNFCILHGIENETSFRIMEETRKKNLILTEEHKQEMLDHGIPQWYIDSCAKIKYMFPRAHAVAYVMMSFRMAWYKVYYPAEFYATYFGSVLADFDADTILRGPQACLQGIDGVKAKGNNATDKEKNQVTVYEVAYEMYARGYRFLDARLGESRAVRFGVSGGKVLLPFAAYDGVGPSAAEAMEAAYREKPFDTIEDCAARAGLGKSVVDVLRKHGVFEGLPESDQVSWTF